MQKLCANPTKAQEIKAIHDFYEMLPENSYLKRLLIGVPDLCETQIKNDFCEPIILDPASKFKQAEEARKLKQENEQLTLENRRLRAQLIEAHEQVYSLARELSMIKATVQQLINLTAKTA